MRWILLAIVLSTSACSSNKYHELPQTTDKDPTWQLNDGKWSLNENAITTPTAPVIKP